MCVGGGGGGGGGGGQHHYISMGRDMPTKGVLFQSLSGTGMYLLYKSGKGFKYVRKGVHVFFERGR